MKESNLKLAQKDIEDALKAVEEMENCINQGTEKNNILKEKFIQYIYSKKLCFCISNFDILFKFINIKLKSLKNLFFLRLHFVFYYLIILLEVHSSILHQFNYSKSCYYNY